MAALVDRTLSRLGLVRRSQIRSQSFTAGGYNRLTWDWATAILSADLEIRGSLYAMRARSRELARNNPHAIGFLNEARKNVIGRTGITLELGLDATSVPGAEAINEKIETAWSRWSRRVTADGRCSMVDASNLWLETLLKDGEVFTRKVRGYPHNDCRFAVEFIDADRVDFRLDRRRVVQADGSVQNEIRMGVEIDEWHRPVAYHILTSHPSEMVPRQHVRIDAAEIDHAYVFRRTQQTRGVPFMHAAMTALNMLGGLEEAELVASRLAACKMGFLVSKTGDEYQGKRKTQTGEIEVENVPGHWEQLPDGVEPKAFDLQHPNSAFAEFQRALLRGIGVGFGCSYAAISGDLRDVNFSSLRQGVLSEREAWRVLQAFAIEHFAEPLYVDWLAMATLSGQLQIPPPPAGDAARYLEAATFTPRGWTWVDPLKDVNASVVGIRACLKTLKSECAEQGIDWRDNIDQRAKEVEYAKEKGVVIDLGGAGERAPETIGEGDAPPAPAPARQQPQPQRKNGLAATMDFPETIGTLPAAEVM